MFVSDFLLLSFKGKMKLNNAQGFVQSSDLMSHLADYVFENTPKVLISSRHLKRHEVSLFLFAKLCIQSLYCTKLCIQSSYCTKLCIQSSYCSTWAKKQCLITNKTRPMRWPSSTNCRPASTSTFDFQGDSWSLEPIMSLNARYVFTRCIL